MRKIFIFVLKYARRKTKLFVSGKLAPLFCKVIIYRQTNINRVNRFIFVFVYFLFPHNFAYLLHFHLATLLLAAVVARSVTPFSVFPHSFFVFVCYYAVFKCVVVYCSQIHCSEFIYYKIINQFVEYNKFYSVIFLWIGTLSIYTNDPSTYTYGMYERCIHS